MKVTYMRVHHKYLQRSSLRGVRGVDMRCSFWDIPVLCFFRFFVIDDPYNRVQVIVGPTWRQSNWVRGDRPHAQLLLDSGAISKLIEDGCFLGGRRCGWLQLAAQLTALPDDHKYQHSDNGKTSANSCHCTGEWKEVRVICNRKKYMPGILSCSASKPQKIHNSVYN